MNETFERYYEVESDPLDLTVEELADLLDAGLNPTEIDRLRFTRWRLQTHQLDGDGAPQKTSRSESPSARPIRWAGPRSAH